MASQRRFAMEPRHRARIAVIQHLAPLGGLGTAQWRVLAAAYLGAVLVGVAFAARSARFELGMVIAWLGVPLLLAWAVNPIMPFFYPRYLLLVAPAYCLLAAWGVAMLGHLGRPLGLVGALLLLGISSYGLGAYYTDQEFVRGRYP